MGAEVIGNWDRMQQRLATLAARARAGLAAAAPAVGAVMVGAIRAEMHSVRPGLHPFSEGEKGDPDPLTGGPMEYRIEYRVEPGGSGVWAVWAGVPAGRLAWLARIHEHGVTIGVTTRMRRYMATRGLFIREDTEYITIPARPFVRPGLAVVPGLVRVRIGAALRAAWREP